MPYGDIYELPIKIKQIDDPETYYQALSGSQLVLTVIDKSFNLFARGTGMSWNEQYQQTPVMEWGQRYCLEIVTGAMTPGQIAVQSIYFMKMNDTLPTQKNLASRRELTAIVQIAKHEDPALAGIVLDVFQGVKIAGRQGNWNAQSLYLSNANMMYRKRMTGLDWKQSNSGVLYPSQPEKSSASRTIANTLVADN